MKRKYFLHRLNEPMQSDTVVYVVWCGESVSEQTLLTKLFAWAYEHQATLMSWREDIDFYLSIEAERVFPGRGLLDFGFVRAELSVREALTLAESDGWETYENGLASPHQFIQMILNVDPSRVRKDESRIVPSKVLTSPRKDLSREACNDKHVIRFT